MADIEYKKGNAKKVTQEKFKKELEALGWEVVKKEKKKKKINDNS